MPVIDQDSYAQFLSLMQASAAQQQNFALAVGQMKQAKDEFAQKIKLQREAMDFERQKFDVEKQLLTAKMDAAKFELDTAKKRQGEQDTAQLEVAEFARGPWAKYLEAKRSGDQVAAQQAQLGISIGLSQMSPAGQMAWMNMQRMATENAWYEPKMQAEVAELLARAESYGVRAGTDISADAAAKNLEAMDLMTKRAFLGDDPEKIHAAESKRLDGLNARHRALVEASNSLSGRLGADSFNLAALAQAGNVPGIQGALNSIAGRMGGNSVDQETARRLNQEWANWMQESTAHGLDMRMTQIRENIASIFATKYLTAMNMVAGRPGSGQAATIITSKAMESMAPFKQALDAILDTDEFRRLGQAWEAGERAQLAQSLIARFTENCPEVDPAELKAAVRAMESALTGVANPQAFEVFKVQGTAAAVAPKGGLGSLME